MRSAIALLALVAVCAAGEETPAVPDFPAELRRAKPVTEIGDAVVYTVNELITDESGIAAARKAGADVLIRGWFKWHNAMDFAKVSSVIQPAHELGALFGGGITCSALYDGENGLTQEQVLDMATRGPDGKLVDAWGERGVRHGSLSSPAYREYLLKWCKQQIDAGADYLFMDEHTAVLGGNEGYDDYSTRDFREVLLRRYVEGKGWTKDDARWRDTLHVDLANRTVCPDGTMGTFDYRAYLAANGLVAQPQGDKNPFAADWHAFRSERDDQAWKWLTDAIRAYARSKNRRVFISANGLARYVDLQVLGVWGDWHVKGNAIDLTESQLQNWAAMVQAGRSMAGGRVPVVFFHDWGFGGFPWMKVSPEQRKLWMRVRGAEVYAAGAFFAFPVHGPFGNDAVKDGTIGEVGHQAAFYQRNRDLYLKAEVAGFEPLETNAPLLSLALWRRADPPALLLHVINREAKDGVPTHRSDVAVQLPTDRAPKAVRMVSPDWDGERPGKVSVEGKKVTVRIPELEAYAVAILDYDTVPELKMSAGRIVPPKRWERPGRNAFVVGKGGVVTDAWELNGYLQGNLHTPMRNPPTFAVKTSKSGTLQVHVRAVATQGGRLEYLVDDQVSKTVDLPDRDGKNDGGAAEYDKTYSFEIPAGTHRLTVRNTGGDWFTVDWYAFEGEFEEP